MRWSIQPPRLHRAILKRVASQYARHGWPVTPGAYRVGSRFRCDRAGCPIERCHPALDDWQTAASSDLAPITRWWSERDHSVLLVTGATFDVIEVPGVLGAPAARALGRAAAPCAVTPAGQWMFFVRPGSALRPELVGERRVLLHGPGSWVPAPPTQFPDGTVSWWIPPSTVDWRLADPHRIQAALAEVTRRRNADARLSEGPPVTPRPMRHALVWPSTADRSVGSSRRLRKRCRRSSYSHR